MLQLTRLLLWRATAGVALLVGFVGIALPVVPTVPFLLVAAWAASKSSPRLERWLITHPRYGEPIRLWRERGVVSRRAKWLASLAMLASSIAMQFTAAPQWTQIVAPLLMSVVALWLWWRPER